MIGDGRITSSPLHFSSGPLALDSIDTAPQPVFNAKRRSRSRLLYPLLALLIVVVLATFGGGMYFYSQMTIGTNVAQHVGDARIAIDKASQEVSTNPTAALHELGSTQSTLQTLLQNNSLTDTQRKSIVGLLEADLTRSVQAAIVSYNKQSAITLLCSSNANANAINDGRIGTEAKTIAQVMGKINGQNIPMLYALGVDNKLYQVNNNSLLLIPLPVTAETKVLAIASTGSELVLLTSLPIKAGAPGHTTTYTLNLLSPEQAKPEHPVFNASAQIDSQLI